MKWNGYCIQHVCWCYPNSVACGKLHAIALFHQYYVNYYCLFLFIFLFTEKLSQRSLAEKNLGVFLILFLLVQFFIYSYSGLKWPTLSDHFENTFFHPGNSINLSDTRGTLAIYPAFVFFIFCLRFFMFFNSFLWFVMIFHDFSWFFRILELPGGIYLYTYLKNMKKYEKRQFLLGFSLFLVLE